MHVLAILQMMALLTLANGAPVVAKKVFGGRFSLPLDCGVRFFDGRPLFGPSKTFRGIAVAMAAGAAMAGDLSSSFVKRRLNRPPSSQAQGLDQIPNPCCRCWHAATC